MKQEEEKLTGLPENAFRELKPGEVYNPLMKMCIRDRYGNMVYLQSQVSTSYPNELI